MQLSDIIAEVRTRTGLNASDAAATDATLTTLINAALRMVNTQYDWPWMEASDSFTSTQSTAAFPAPTLGVRKMRWVRNGRHELRFRNYRSTGDYDDYEGRPVGYTEDTGTFTLLPTPDGAYEIEYGYIIDKEPPLTTGSDTPLVPDYAIDLVIAYVGVLVFRRLRDREQERVFYSEYRNTLTRLKDEIIETNEGFTPRRTRNES